MDIKTVFTIASVVVGIGAFLPYIKDVLTRQTEPHEFTWLVWAITQGTATVGVWKGGGGYAAAYPAIGTALVIFIFILSLFDGKTNIVKTDILALFVALSAIGVWTILDNPLIAILMVSGIDMIGYVPTFRKSYMNPWSETAKAWFAGGVASLLTMLALDTYNFLTMTYVTTLALANFTLTIFLLQRRRKISPHTIKK